MSFISNREAGSKRRVGHAAALVPKSKFKEYGVRRMVSNGGRDTGNMSVIVMISIYVDPWGRGGAAES